MIPTAPVPAPVGLDRLAAFVGALRDGGVPVPGDALITYAESFAVVAAEPHGLYWAGRAALVTRRQDHARYDELFRRFWPGVPAAAAAATGVASSSTAAAPLGGSRHPRPVVSTLPAADGERDTVTDGDARAGASIDNGPSVDGAGAEAADTDTDAVMPAWRASRREVLRTRDFAAYDRHELALARSLMAEVRLTGPVRPTRRVRSARHGRGRLDLRHTIAAAQRTGGEIVTVHRTRRIDAPRRVVFLLDISGSMADYSRGLLQFAQVAASARTKVEVFTMGTRLTRLTRELRGHDPDVALARAAEAVPDWAGGTRLGASLERFNDEWGTRGTARGAVVVLLSDGWERDDPAVLVEQLARLRRVAHRVVWVNPLKASPQYEPLARGMAAALPFVDAFVSGHNIASLDEVAAVVRGAVARSAP